MSEELVVHQCSPTLAGLKTASLFPCPPEERAVFLESLRKLNLQLVPRGVRLIPVKFGKNHTLVYLYRPGRLQKDLSDSTARAILKELDYPAENANRCLAELIRRLERGEDFPHEIGLFLGYPAEDVNGFIKQKARNAKYTGAWKVYGDVESAKRKFALYKKCTRLYRAAYERDRSFDRLVVNCR